MYMRLYMEVMHLVIIAVYHIITNYCSSLCMFGDITVSHVTSCDHQAYTKNNKRLVVKMDKAEGLAAADYGKTSDP